MVICPYFLHLILCGMIVSVHSVYLLSKQVTLVPGMPAGCLPSQTVAVLLYGCWRTLLSAVNHSLLSVLWTKGLELVSFD